jgi:hypothetical protein
MKHGQAAATIGESKVSAKPVTGAFMAMTQLPALTLKKSTASGLHKRYCNY